MYRYIGNKTKLAPWLISRIKDILPSGGTVADLMCGTASVSESLRQAGFRVIASDLMTFAAHHARVRLLLNEEPSFGRLGLTYSVVLAKLNELPGEDGFFFREYSPAGKPAYGGEPRKYLTAVNASRLDAINRQINQWNDEGLLTEIENSLLRHNLIMAVNRVANIAGTYGHYRSSWNKASHDELRLRQSAFVQGRTDHLVLQGPAEQIAGTIRADLCYLDPPYMKRQYGANYHFIETIARGDEPEAVGISGLRPWRDQYSNFCTRTKIQDSFRAVINEMNCPKFLISYSSDGLLKENELLEVLAPLADVSIEKQSYPRFRSNKSKLGTFVDEYLITLVKRDTEQLPVPRAVGAM